MSHYISQSKHQLKKKIPKKAPTRASFGLQRLRRQRLLFVLTGLMICVTTLAFSPSLADISNVVRFSCMAFVLMLGCLFSVYSKQVPVTVGTVAFALFVLFQAVSMLWAVNRAEALFDVSKWVMALFVILFSYNLFRRYPAKSVVMMVYVSAIVCVVSLAVAIIQAVRIGDLSGANRYGIVSLFTHKGTYSMLMLLTLLFPIMGLRLGLKKIRFMSIIVMVVQIGILLFLQARAVWLAGMAILLTMLLLWPFRCRDVKTQGRLAGTLILASVMALVLVGGSRYFANLHLPGPDQREGLFSNASVYERQSLWRMTFRMIDKRPLAGCGAGNWKVCYPEASVRDVFSIDMLDYQFVRPHNDFLRVLSETGYVSLVFLMLAFSSLIVNAVIVAGNRQRYGEMAGTAVALFIGVMVFAIFDFPFDRMELLFWISIMCGAIIAFTDLRRQISNKMIINVVGGVILAFVFFVGISHWRSESYYSEIVNHIHRGDWKTVEHLSKKARTLFCNLTPKAIPYAYYEAMAQEYLHKPALETYRMALHDSPYNKKILNDLGRLEYVVNHDIETAIFYLEESIRISPGYSYAYFNLAQVYLQENQKEKAAELLQQLDLDCKQGQMEKMVWHYHQGETANYYVHVAVPAERAYKERLLEQTR